MTGRELFVKFVDTISVEGNSTLGFAAVAVYYIIMYFACNDYFMAVKLWDVAYIWLNYVDFSFLGMVSYLVCNALAKHFLNKEITIYKIFVFCLFLWVSCVPLCWFTNWTMHVYNVEENEGVFYVRLIVFMLLISVTLVQACGNVIKKKNEEKLKLIEELKSEREKAVKAQLNMLKLQLDPHFMFNSLGTLSGIIVADPQKALDFTSRLARIYKYIVAHISDDTITLHSGMDFIHDYCQHIEMRYKDNFIFDIEEHIWHDDEELILPLSLQLLVENAVKHNQHSVEHPLRIRIYREDDFVCVSNQVVPYEEIGRTRVGSTGIGIKNLYDRYKLLTDKLPIVLQSATTYTVQIPIVREIKAENKTSLL